MLEQGAIFLSERQKDSRIHYEAGLAPSCSPAALWTEYFAAGCTASEKQLDFLREGLAPSCSPAAQISYGMHRTAEDAGENVTSPPHPPNTARHFPLKGKACKPLSGSTAAQTLWEKPSIRPLTPPVRPAARPAPGGTDRSRACQNSRHIPSARRARTATDTPRPTTAAAQNTPRIAASAFHPLSSAKLLCIRITFSISLYSLE